MKRKRPDRTYGIKAKLTQRNNKFFERQTSRAPIRTREFTQLKKNKDVVPQGATLGQQALSPASIN